MNFVSLHMSLVLLPQISNIFVSARLLENYRRASGIHLLRTHSPLIPQLTFLYLLLIILNSPILIHSRFKYSLERRALVVPN